jgi:hypothetical protein
MEDRGFAGRMAAAGRVKNKPSPPVFLVMHSLVLLFIGSPMIFQAFPAG